MKAGQFNLNEYLEKLNEAAEGGQIPDKEGMVIPPENQKAYQWLKKEYQKAQTEVKVEINMGGEKFEPGYDMQTKLDSVKEFKPGMFGEVKTAENKSSISKTKGTLDPNKSKETFGKEEGKKSEKEEKKPVKAATPEKPEKKEPEKKEPEKKEEKPEHKKEEEPEVQKIDLKTKKK